MKKKLLILLCVVTITGCWSETTPQKFIRPVKLQKAEPLVAYEKEFVGVVSAEQYTNYAFLVGGLIEHMYIEEGSFVKKGDLMAALDPADILLRFEADKANYLTTKSILERNKKLLTKQAISEQDYEIALANYQKAKSAFEYAKNQLEYTKLKAPFNGSVEKKYVENYQRVNPGEPIYKIINPNVLEVNFTLPERESLISPNAKFFVEFDNLRGEEFQAQIKEIVDASVDGAGIPVTLAITDKTFNPVKLNIKAGFSCRVKIVTLIDSNISLTTVPITAIFTKDGNEKDKFVWVYNPETKTVDSKIVTTDGMIGIDLVIISKGVTKGEQIVVAGVYQLVDNQAVNVLNNNK